ncbi:MAG: F0F1 ATP synthase subunit A [Magnetococcales bacterium]|nr:F0F1 ATP synthase subunit A [Magnetococcales bacterium]
MISTAIASETAHAAASAAPKLEPLHHFQVQKIVPLSLFGWDISITNSSLWMMISVAAILLFFKMALKNEAKVPGRLQSLAEMGFVFARDLVQDNIGDEGRKYFPLVLALFFFVLFNNLLGLIPGSFTATSQLIVTGTLAIGVFILSVGIGVARHGVGFLKTFAPGGLPLALLPLMIPIEVISFLARPVSLAVRLFANMTAGHTVLGVMIFFTVTLPVWAGVIPLSFAVVLTGVEIFIGFIQAYIFAILTCVYINDAMHMH